MGTVNKHVYHIDKNGSSAETSIMDPVDNRRTILRVILDLTISSETSSAAIQKLFSELWVKRNGLSLPTIDTTTLVAYGNVLELYWVQSFATYTNNTTNYNSREYYRDIKGKRILEQNDSFVMRFSGGAFHMITGTITIFYMDV